MQNNILNIKQIQLNTQYQSQILSQKTLYNNLISPTSERDFVWIGQYPNANISEYDFRTRQENPFNAILKENLIEFGILGCNYYFYFTTFDGMFRLEEKNIEFLYRLHDKNGQEKIYKLTGNKNSYNDIITFKDVESTFSTMESHSHLKANIYQYNFGYKTKLVTEDATFWFKVICTVPITGEPIFITIRLVSDNNLQGDFIIMKNGEPTAIIEAPLSKDIASEMKWIVE